MRKKKSFFIAITILIAVLVFLRIQSGSIYLSHTAVAKVTIEDLLKDNKLSELALLINTSITNNQAHTQAWTLEKVELINTIPFWQAIFDDDPIYRLKAHIAIKDGKGNQSTIVWESWRYGVVLGPLVLSLGDGPPGYIVGGWLLTPN
jgi:hypothetical protein